MTGEQESYLLGWMYSDGCITYNEQAQTHSCKIKIHSKDKDVLLKLNSFLNWSYSDYSDNKKKEALINTYDKKWFKYFITKGVLPQKSVEMRNAIFFPDVKDKNLFIRGLLDGDGHYSLVNNRLNIAFTCTNLYLVKDVIKYLQDNSVECHYLKLTKNRDLPMYGFRIRNIENCTKFRDLIFKDNLELTLDRKYNIVKLADYTPILERKTKLNSEKVEVTDIEGNLLGLFESCYQLDRLSQDLSFYLWNYIEPGKKSLLRGSNVSTACRTGKPYKGLYFEYVANDKQDELTGSSLELITPTNSSDTYWGIVNHSGMVKENKIG